MNLKKNFNPIENLLLKLFIFGFLFFTFLIFFSDFISDQTLEIKFKSILMLIIPFFLTIFYIYDKNRDSIPLFQIYLLYFSIPAGLFGLIGYKLENLIFNNVDSFKMTDDIYVEALDVTLIFCYILLLIFTFSKYLKFNHVKRKNSIQISQGIIPFIFFLYFIFIDKESFVDQINLILFPLGIFSSLIFYYFFIKSHKLILKIIFILPIVIVLLHYILNWTLLNMVIILISLFILNIKITNKVNYFLIFLIFLTPISLSKIKNEIRIIISDQYVVNDFKNDNFQNKSIIKRFKIIFDFYDQREKYSFDHQINDLIKMVEKNRDKTIEIAPNLISKSSLDFFLLRISENNFNLSRMIFYKNKETKFINGESLNQILISLVPRVIWSEKPSMSLGNKFGKSFNILNHDNKTTSININWLNEFYWNFKLQGIILGSILLGAFLICVNLISNRLNDMNFIIVLSSISMILIPESNLSIYLTFSLKSFVLLYVISFFINKLLNQSKFKSHDISN
tara:strand:- start:97 stop:1623 length:1527 start_codon:yes stop_codon:yes gene_type:complete